MSRPTSISDGSSSRSEADEHDYQTDFTTPAASDSSPDETEGEEIDDFRDREYPQLKGKVYLDHGGTTLYAKSLMEAFSHDMISNLYGNPHSASSPSALAGHRVDAIRAKALRFFNADPEEWDLVFTQNATASIKLVIECFRDHAAVSNTPVWYGYHRDAHTSLVGVRELTKMHRCFTSDEEVDLWINSGGLGGPRARQLGLFAYPGQSNMTGRRLPQAWPGKIRKTFHKAATYTLLDAAALASTAPLDLANTATAPDFVALSFYKIFGFPNIGALLVQKKSQHVLEHRRYFGGGTVDMIITINDTWHAKKEDSLHEKLEDGTLPFHSIFALDHAMDVHERLYGPNPMKFISHHTAQLGKQMYDGLVNLRHKNGHPLAIIYKDDNAVYGDPSVQGSTVAFNVQRADGTIVGYEEVEEAADDRNIYVRSGSLCNPGGVATYLKWTPADMKAAFAAGHRCSRPTQVMFGKPTGVVRVSLGAMSTSSDVATFLDFLREVYIDGASDAQLAASVSLHNRNTLQARAIQISSAPTSPASVSQAVFPTSPASISQAVFPTSPASISQSVFTKIPHALHVPSEEHRPSTAAPSIAPSTTSENASTWENVTTALPSRHASVANRTTSQTTVKPHPFISDQQYFPAKLARQGQQRTASTTTAIPRSMSHKTLTHHGSMTGMEIKVQEFGIPKDPNAMKSPSVKSRKFGRSVVNLLHRKGHAVTAGFSHPDIV